MIEKKQAAYGVISTNESRRLRIWTSQCTIMTSVFCTPENHKNNLRKIKMGGFGDKLYPSLKLLMWKMANFDLEKNDD